MFELVISVIQTLALVGICMALIGLFSCHIKEVRFCTYYVVMNHLGLHNQLAQLGSLADDDVRDKLEDTIDISRRYVKEIAPEEFED